MKIKRYFTLNLHNAIIFLIISLIIYLIHRIINCIFGIPETILLIISFCILPAYIIISAIYIMFNEDKLEIRRKNEAKKINIRKNAE